MKKLLFLFISQVIILTAMAQVPGEINYQGVARNNSGNPLPNQQIRLRLSIRDDNANGTILYQETRQLKTNNFGLFTLAIGSAGASNVAGTVQGINWGNGKSKYLQVEIDPAGGYVFVHMGAAQLLSVPYALYAAGAAPSGSAGGSLKGSYPNPTLANGAVTTITIQDKAITESKLDDASVSTVKIADGAVTGDKISDSSITAEKLATGVIPTGLPPTGAASGDLTGNYPAPGIATGAVTSTKISDGAIITAKISDASVTTNKLANASVTSAKIADGSVGTTKITDASVTSAKIADGSVGTTKITNAAVTTEKIKDSSITAEKLAPGLIVGGTSPTGSAGGDLSGNYPNPNIASQAVTQSKIANGAVNTPKITDGAVTTAKIADQAITAAKLAPGVIPTSLPPSGSAGGDLSGTYPNPLIGKLQGVTLSNTAPTSGQVLKYNGTQWAPAVDNSFSVPYSSSVNSASNLFAITNQGSGAALEGVNSSTTAIAYGVLGRINATSPGASSAAVRAINNSTNAAGYGLWATHSGSGAGVYGTSEGGSGIKGHGTTGYGTYGSSVDGIGVFGTSDNGIPAFFTVSNSANFNDAIFSSNSGFGNGLVSISTYANGVLGIANDIAGAGVFGINNAGGEAVVGRSFSDFAAAVVGRNDGLYAGVRAVSAAWNGTAFVAQANAEGSDNGTAMVAELESGTGNLAVFKVGGSNVARIDHTGKAYFNNGTQVGGADVAEFFEVEGSRNTYEPGDVLVISTHSDRRVEKSSEPYSFLVSGVFATKAGLMLTEENAEQDQLQHMVPMGVIGVLPTKVCNEGGVIRRGDLLVTSSIPGVAMKADPDKVKVGQVLGKALQGFDGSGIGKINVLVSVK